MRRPADWAAPGSPGAAGTGDRSQARALAVIARAAWARRQLLCLLAGLLVLGGGHLLASPLAFVAGLVMVGASAPQGLAPSPEAATVRTWQRLHRGRPLTRGGQSSPR